MMVKSFFTPVELGNGLVSSERVEELVSVMEENAEGEEETEWRMTVATTIALTDDRSCLDLFLHREGASFIGRWLDRASELSSSPDLIRALTSALEKLNSVSGVSPAPRHDAAELGVSPGSSYGTCSSPSVADDNADGGGTNADDLEYGLVDALEVARMVAKEVEREVVDREDPYRTSSGSGSDPIDESAPSRGFDLNAEVVQEDGRADFPDIDLNFGLPDLNRTGDEPDAENQLQEPETSSTRSSPAPPDWNIDLNGPCPWTSCSENGSSNPYSSGTTATDTERHDECTVICLMGKKIVVGGGGRTVRPTPPFYYGAVPQMSPSVVPFQKLCPLPTPPQMAPFDLNSSFVIGAAAQREPPPSFLHRLLVPGDDRLRSGSGASREPKRPEPDGGWDPYPFLSRRPWN